jgi:peptide/nickel transport system substrate-binding protein
MFNKRWALTGLILVVAVVLAACATGEVQTVVVTEIVEREGETVVETVIVEVGPEEEVVVEDTLIICMSQEPDSLYRVTSNMAVTVRALAPASMRGWIVDRGFFYETHALVNDEFPTFDNGGAEFIGEGDDAQLQVTYHYKDNITWSDGEPFTVDDVLYTREVVLDENSGAVTRGILDQQEFVKIDDYTLQVTYPPGVQDPTYFLPPLSSSEGVSDPLPEHVLSEMTAEEIRDSEFARLPNPTLGAYEFVEWVEGDRIVLSGVDGWWGGDVATPNVIFRIITDTNQLLAATLSGECDFATDDGLQLTQVPFIQQSADQGLVAYDAIPALVWEHIDLNSYPPEGAETDALPFFVDPRVRQAIAYGTNRLQMTEQILYGEVDPLTSYLPADHWAWNPDTAAEYPYDPEQAMALLEEAGWTDADGDGVREAAAAIDLEYSCGRGAAKTIPAGTPFEVSFHTTTGNAMREQLSTLFQSNMADIGIKINLDLLPASVWFGDDGPLNQRTFQVGEFAWVSDPDPAALFLYAGTNVYRTEDGRFVNAVDLWEEMGGAVGSLDYETFAFGRPTEEDLADTGLTKSYNEQIPSATDDLEGGNYLGWCNAAATQAAFDGENLIDPEARLPFYLDLQNIMIEDVPTVPLFQRLNVSAFSPRLCGPALGPANTPTWNVNDWYLGDDCVE